MRVERPSDRVYRQRWWTLAVLDLAVFVVVLDDTILNIALPALQRELGATSSQLQWILDSYLLVFAGLLLAAGSLGDRFGRKGALQLGLVVFGGGSLASALSQDPNQLIAARSVMGVGAAFIMPTTLSILTNVFPAEERAKAIGIWSGVVGLGIAIGPLASGALLEHFWWGSVFMVNVPVTALGLLAAAALVPDSRDPAAPPVDVPGAALSIGGLGALIFAIIEAPSAGWTSMRTLATFAAAAVVLALFAAWERRSAHPMLDLRFFRSARFSTSAASIMLTFFALLGLLFVLTQHLQFYLGYSPLGAGARAAPVAVAVMGGALIAAFAVARVGARLMVGSGLLIVALGLLVIAGGREGGYPPVLAGMLTIGLGMGLAMTPATDAVMGSLPKARAGVGSAVNDTTRQVGGAFGVAVVGSIFSSRYREAMDGAVAALPAPVRELASDSLGGALFVASEAGGPASDVLVAAARAAFVDALGWSLVITAAVAGAASLLAFALLPSRETRTPEEIEDAFLAGTLPRGESMFDWLVGERRSGR